jgi:hypothetical protein
MERAAKRLFNFLARLRWPERKTRYVPGEYCPHCGAKKVLIDIIHTGSRLHLVCALCRHGYMDTPASRWGIMKFPGTNARKIDPGTFAADHPRNARMLRRGLGRFAPPLLLTRGRHIPYARPDGEPLAFSGESYNSPPPGNLGYCVHHHDGHTNCAVARARSKRFEPS